MLPGDVEPVEWSSLEDSSFFGEDVDPVLKGMVREFCDFHATLQCIQGELEVYLEGVKSFTDGLFGLADGLMGDFAACKDHHLTSDSCRLREAANRIVREDAPDSALAKLQRNLDFNVMQPINKHMENNEKVKTLIEKRQRRFEEFELAQEQLEECKKRDLSEEDQRRQLAQLEADSARKAFAEADRLTFEWLYVLEEHRYDILDSALQTLKFVQYDFFSMAARALSGSLPARMAFRPTVEMTPECLEAQVEAQLREEEEGAEVDIAADLMLTGRAEATEQPSKRFAERLVDRLAKEDAASQSEVTVDFLSLQALLSQGVEESQARRALRIHHNDTQAALDWVLSGGDSRPVEADDVRRPTAGRNRVRRLQALLDRQEEDSARRHARKRNAAAATAATAAVALETATAGASLEPAPGKFGVSDLPAPRP
eukprot:TRINITY_DN48727_c0_g1_i1.p1 TRINITY_DN48727_c0_g1~~TRINITY_DN48727_c0_g1_i1.p1  ORF type:complete len:429 (+),score=156.48 TRINITY_DN48727_c0_g1_i1:223-1509(+)